MGAALVALPLTVWPTAPLTAVWPAVPLRGPVTFVAVAVVVLAARIAARDRWLGAIVFVAGLEIFVHRLVAPGDLPALGMESALIFALGCFMLVQLRVVSVGARVRIVRILAGLGIVQSVYLLSQYARGLDALGTFAMVDERTAFIAITASVMPLWALPIALGAVYVGHSLGAQAALGAGLAMRYLPQLRRSPGRTLGVLGPVVLVGAYHLHGKGVSTESVSSRFVLWQFGLTQFVTNGDWLDWLTGWGLGGWSFYVPLLQRDHGVLLHLGWGHKAHNTSGCNLRWSAGRWASCCSAGGYGDIGA